MGAFKGSSDLGVPCAFVRASESEHACISIVTLFKIKFLERVFQVRVILIPTSCPLVLDNIPANLTLKPYFLALMLNALSSSSLFAREAFPVYHRPLIWPRIPHGASRTFGLFLTRFTLPV